MFLASKMSILTDHEASGEGFVLLVFLVSKMSVFTEAGEGEDGRIKSAVGIGSLLEDGVGDTIRVSLTEDPELEIPVAQQLVQRYSTRNSHSEIRSIKNPPFQPYDYTRRSTVSTGNIGGKNVPRVIIDLSSINKLIPENLIDAGYIYSENHDKWTISDQAADFVYIDVFLLNLH